MNDEKTKLSVIFIWRMIIRQTFKRNNFPTLKLMISICWWRSVAFHFVKFPVGIMFSCIHVSHCAIKSELLKEEVSLYQLVYLSSQQSPIYILNVLTLNRDVLRCWSKKFSFLCYLEISTTICIVVFKKVEWKKFLIINCSKGKQIAYHNTKIKE